jgi:DNA/RNA endonuclease G (NUC1)
MKRILFLLLISLSSFAFSQKVDTVITTSIYKSYISYSTKTPLFVAYKLYHGGGSCDRNKQGFAFKCDGINPNKIMNDDNYQHSGYDKGHMANSEDFAGNCVFDELTFRYYNALPQTPNCNRGPWKSLETELRKESQSDSLLIVCGGWSFAKKEITYVNPKDKDKPNAKVYHGSIIAPEYCFKIVKNLRNGNIKCYIFTNDDNSVMTQLTYEEFLNKVPYELEFMKYDLDFQ